MKKFCFQVGKRSVELNSELQGLERSLDSKERSVRLVNEALELYDESSVDDMFKGNQDANFIEL